MDALAHAIAGIEQLAGIPRETRDSAIAALRRWWEAEETAIYRPAITSLAQSGRADELLDAFRQVLPFGTGGRRGLVGVGPNRINPWTVASSIQGHVDWLSRRFPSRPLRVVIAYDVRRFEDSRGVYGEAQGPLRSLTSRQLAEVAASVYTACGISVFLLERSSSRYLSTPELSFSIRALSADGGVNISASHNPPDDNGVKVYDETGAQLAPPEDQDLLDEVARVEKVRSWSFEDAIASGLVSWLTDDIHTRYLSASASIVPEAARRSPIGLYYTPLHGTGLVHEALAAAGYPCALHAPQASPDGAFPTVPGRVANPEVEAAMADALSAAPPGTDLVFGTDPDADRLGCEVLHQGRWVHLTGNDIATLAVHAVTHAPSQDKRRPLVLITEVTSSLVGRVGRAAGALVVDDLLVGFKYVAEALKALEREGRWREIRKEEVRFVAGAEESHGVLLTDQIRDKDAAGGAVALAHLAAGLKEDGRTLVDLLEELRREHGAILNAQVSLQYPGASGQQRLAELLDGLRAAPPPAIGARSVRSAVDHRDERGPRGSFLSDSDRSARNVLSYALAPGALDEGARVILRPSGTEPKLKVYVELLGHRGLSPDGIGQLQAQMASLCAAVRAWLSA